MPIVAALVPPLLVTLGGGAIQTELQARAITLGLALGADHSGAAPLAQLLSPLGTLLPFGDLDLRAELALSIPAAIAAALITRRAGLHPSGTGGFAPRAIVLAIGVVAGAILGACDASTSMLVIAAELALAVLFLPTARRRKALPIAIAAGAFAAWCSPRGAPPIAIALLLAARASGPSSSKGILEGALARGAAIFAPILAMGLLLDAVRSERAWLVLGRALTDGVFARAPGVLFSGASSVSSASGASGSSFVRIAIASAVLATVAIVSAASARKLADDDRVAALTAIAFAIDAWLLRPPGLFSPAIVLILPTAAATLGALHIAVDRALGQKVAPAWRALSWLVPALALGAASRIVEDELGARHVGGDPAAAAGMATLATTGVDPPRAVSIVEDEDTLVRLAHDRALFALRPDMRLLPTHTLLLGGAARMAARTIDAIPASGEVVRGLLATGSLEEADVAPLAQQVPVLAALPTARVKELSRHVDATGDAVLLAIERIDPSDRHVRRVPLERRLAFVVSALSSEPTFDRTRSALRVAATREARLLSLAGDREGTLAALVRALALGADAARIARWNAKLKSRLSIESEPLSEDD